MRLLIIWYGIFFLLVGVVTVRWYQSTHSTISPSTMSNTTTRISGPIAVAKVFGGVERCKESDLQFIELVANISKEQGIDPSLLASMIVTESRCDPLAISSRGAVGLMQIRPSVWKDKFDFSKENLFNPETNIRIGANILKGLIQKNGIKKGIRLYQGKGKKCSTCNNGYTAKVLRQASLRETL
jgi:hypothetical protein